MMLVAGAVYLGGGGSAADEAQLWQAMLANKRRVLYWPFALPQPVLIDAQRWLHDALTTCGTDVEVETWPSLHRRDPDVPADVDLLFIGGGNTFRLLHEVRAHGFIDAVRTYVKAGGSYYGGSAGAILAGADVATAADMDTNDVGVQDCSGLDLLSGCTVLPHFAPEKLDDAYACSRRLRAPLIAIPERSGVVVENRTARVVGTEDVLFITAADAVPRAPGVRWSLP